MAVDYFLKLDGIEGESTDRDHKGEIDVLSFSWGAAQEGINDGGGGGGTGKVTLQDFHFTANFNKASPALFFACASGKHIKQGVLIGRSDRKGREAFYKVTLTDVLVSSYQTGGSGDSVPTDQFSLNFAKIEYNGNSVDTRGGEVQ
jgi:type VI secretion system secreted protein Hcp